MDCCYWLLTGVEEDKLNSHQVGPFCSPIWAPFTRRLPADGTALVDGRLLLRTELIERFFISAAAHKQTPTRQETYQAGAGQQRRYVAFAGTP